MPFYNDFSKEINWQYFLQHFVLWSACYTCMVPYCDSFYVGKTKRHLETRLKEHQNFKIPTAVTLHIMKYEHCITIDDMNITYGKNDKELLIKESLVVKNRKPVLNNNVKSYPLELF